MSRRRLVASCCGRPAVPPLPTGLTARHPSPDDRTALAALMLDAYAGTIDADGDETLETALEEVGGYFEGRSGPAMPHHSWVAVTGGALVAASLITDWKGHPLVAYAYTATDWKGQRVASALLAASMDSLCNAGLAKVALFVTAGNAPAERVYDRLGFREIVGGSRDERV